jgi:hypothetical protein
MGLQSTMLEPHFEAERACKEGITMTETTDRQGTGAKPAVSRKPDRQFVDAVVRHHLIESRKRLARAVPRRRRRSGVPMPELRSTPS